MEKSTEKLNKEHGSTAPGAPQAENQSPAPAVECAAGMSSAGPQTEDVKSLGFTEECVKETERPSGMEQDSPDASKPAVLERGCPSSVPLVLTNKNPPEGHGLEMNHQCSTTSIDLDCLVCFNKYSMNRVPKLLDCQHAFCAVCLKLILRKDGNTWIITCPLCRKATFVSGGLIRTLQTKEDIMKHLESPSSHPEVHISATGLGSSSWTRSSRDLRYRDENVPADNMLAVQRLLLLLLLAVILTILILPFIYSGMVKWVVCLMLALGVVMSVALCCTPKFFWRSNRDVLTSCHKETHIAAIA
ncbi:E3 ubiquitin-protein ligase RNF186 [Strigops habroptila]|uniref:E3 ubiquitin-protein ligase RNF186 n=1 Tax=Strigops habroptila TaxID=2489341 RepID=UPI0011D01070|nr:E3 ubiquitin-protein ligase RNF186 [Strigops habroptila]